ncbi:hypothetical protein TIFTF001_009648 [Ficus carica]|uniref:BED-type domain-containing protein n=1 Tax=Ficus carica TaxID=3494 RepID=A0AA88AHG9_FICCA|nr:hypothetical protein TIFTF001_009648 [Ficus carica]
MPHPSCEPSPIDLEKGTDEKMVKGKELRKRKPLKIPKQSREIWEHFKRVKDDGGNIKAVCNYCKMSYASHPKKHGTSSLRSHLKACPENPKTVDPLILNLKVAETIGRVCILAWLGSILDLDLQYRIWMD